VKARTRRIVVGTAIVAAGGSLLYFALRRPRWSFGEPNTATLDRDPSHLLPAFADALELVFRDLRAMGWDPMLHEGRRSAARAKQLDEAAGSPGKADSLHIWGAAADIVSRSKLWSDPKFFVALATVARKHGLTSGTDFGDDNHVQAVTYKDEDALRAQKSVAAANNFVRAKLAA
jgi:hypothetical protein